MSRIKPDRRIAKTRSGLALALFELMQSQNWNAITVRQICETANVARASFYAHFETKIDLLDYLIAEQFSLEEINVVDSKSAPSYVNFLVWLVDHLTSSKPLFSRFAREPEMLPVLARFKMALAKQFSTVLKRDGIIVDETAIAFVLGGTFDALIVWSRQWKIKLVPQLRADILTMAAKILEPK